MNDVEQLEKVMLDLDQVETPLTHRFAPGVYLREIFMPKSSIVIGHEHKTKHFNIVISGAAYVSFGDGIVSIEAGDTFTSEAGVRKALYITEDMVWQTIHPIDTDASEWTPEEQLALVGTLEGELISKSNTFLEHEEEFQLRVSELLEVAK